MLGFLLGLMAASSAAIVTVPSGLQPGDAYRLVFVTDGSRSASSSNIDVYNTFVADQAAQSAELVDLETTWKAIASTNSVNARTNAGLSFTTSSPPIYNLAGELVANHNVDLWDGSIGSTINITQSGAVSLDERTWTGTDDDGTTMSLAALGYAGGFSMMGDTEGLTAGWIRRTSDPQSFSHPMYAISGELTVVPEPTMLSLLLLTAWPLVCRRRRPS